MGGCLLGALAGLLALAIPASIAPASLIGAYVVIVALAAAAYGAVYWRSRRPNRPAELPPPRAAALRIAAVAIVYAAVVTVIHVAT